VGVAQREFMGGAEKMNTWENGEHGRKRFYQGRILAFCFSCDEKSAVVEVWERVKMKGVEGEQDK